MFLLICRCCFQSVLCWRTRTLMIHWCQKLLTCTKQTGISMRQLQGAGPRSMPWAKCACEETLFLLYTYTCISVLCNTEVWTNPETNTRDGNVPLKGGKTNVLLLIVCINTWSLKPINVSQINLLPHDSTTSEYVYNSSSFLQNTYK